MAAFGLLSNGQVSRSHSKSGSMSRKGPVVDKGMLDFVRIERLDLVLH